MTPYAPISTAKVIQAVEAADEERLALLSERWPELAVALGELLRSNGRGVPVRWQQRSPSSLR